MAKHNETGAIGESVTAKYLENKGFLIIDRNYRKKWGELDIVAEKEGIIHIIEVKTVSRPSFGPTSLSSDKTRVFEQEINNYRPEDNMHPWKIQRLQRAIQTYLLEKFPGPTKASRDKQKDVVWQFDLACVFLDQEKRVAKVRFMENIIL